VTTKIAIVGSGFGMYGLLPAFSDIKGCKVVSICGKNSERMLDYCKKLNLNQYTNWKEMLQKEKPDAVAIAVIPKHQYTIAKYALENNIAVFAEKPLSTSLQTSLELNKLAKEKKLPNMVDFIFPEIPEWNSAKKAIENGLIGKILNVTVDWNFLSHDLKNGIDSWKTDVEQGGGALSFYFSHVLYYLEYFLGMIKNIQYTCSSSKKSLNKGETSINMIILFENGCIGNAHMDISSIDQPKHTVKFHGEKNSILLQNNSNNFFDNFELTINTSKEIQKINFSHDESEDPRVKLVKHIAMRFIDWCNTGVSSKPSFEDGLRVEELIEMARVSNSKFLA
jgi:predicted dehydrogenase